MRFGYKFSSSFFIIILICILSNTGSAQNTGILRGNIADSTSGEVLPYANVYIQELKTGASTDSRGNFIINAIPGSHQYTVIVSFIGYQSKTLTAKIFNNKTTFINVFLVPTNLQLQTVEKVGEKIIKKNETDLGVQRLSMRQLEVMPKGVETDVFRSLQTLPGVRSTGDVSARYYVRGGTSDQNLVLINGITVYNPFHALGLFSVIDPDMINSIEFYKGGFSAQYDDRLSSVLDIVTKNGNQNNFAGKFSSSYLTGKGLFEGPIPNGSFIITGRKSYSNSILKKFLNDQNVPIDFYDASFKINYSNPDLYKRAKFSVFGFVSGDKVKYDDPTREDFKWGNDLFGFEWLQVYDVPLYSRLGLSISKFHGEVNPNQSTIKPKKNDVSDITATFDLTNFFQSKDELGLGFKFKTLKTNLIITNRQGVESNIEEFSGNLSVYGKYKFLRFENFGADIGTRYNFAGLSKNGSGILEPRVNFTYRFIPEIALKGAWGIYLQEISTISDENEVISLFEPWVITPDYLSPATAIHYVVGTEINFSSEQSIDIEGYYKIVHNLPVVNQNKIYSFEPDLITGSGESYGWEFLYKFVNTHFNFSASYTLSWAYKSVEDYIYYPKYDSRHSVNIDLEYNFGSGWHASANWSFNSGLPFTPLLGYYDKYYLNDFGSTWYSDDNFKPYLILGDRNIERLPVYHRLDLSFSKSLTIDFVKASLDFSLINVYNRKNIFYFKRETGERVNMLPFLPTATLKIEL